MKTSILLLLFLPVYLSAQNVFPTSGNVGVGTSSPTSDLHISKNDNVFFLVERTDGSWGRFAAGTAGAAFYFKSDGRFTFSPATNPDAIFPDYANSLFIYGPDHPTYPGRVSIGSEAPGDNSKLSVNGNIRSEELKIVSDIEAPDYVFSPSYKLRTLEEIESFISKNSHLPEIPSGAEFKENGIVIGEMSFNLLKKIEELTLYLIEMDKTIKDLTKEVEYLKTIKN